MSGKGMNELFYMNYLATVEIDSSKDEHEEAVVKYSRVFFPLSVKNGRRSGRTLTSLVQRVADDARDKHLIALKENMFLDVSRGRGGYSFKEYIDLLPRYHGIINDSYWSSNLT